MIKWWIAILFSQTLHAQALSEYAQGEYLTRAAGCHDCHTVTYDRYMAGGLKLPTPFGDFYSPNITPSIENGIGSWTFNDFKEALRYGIGPNSIHYYPAFPYPAFSKIRDEDMRKIWNYLRAQQPIEQRNRPHDLAAPYNQRWLMRFWQAWFFWNPSGDVQTDQRTRRGPFPDDPSQSAVYNRGAYLVEAFLHCTECHTPRNSGGALILDRWMGGSDLLVDGVQVPNITPDPDTGTGKWTKQDWTRFLSAGITPSGRYVGGEMARVIQNTSGLTIEDRAAVIHYLTSLQPLRGWPSVAR